MQILTNPLPRGEWVFLYNPHIWGSFGNCVHSIQYNIHSLFKSRHSFPTSRWQGVRHVGSIKSKIVQFARYPVPMGRVFHRVSQSQGCIHAAGIIPVFLLNIHIRYRSSVLHLAARWISTQPPFVSVDGGYLLVPGRWHLAI
jgi:hypothetical protein